MQNTDWQSTRDLQRVLEAAHPNLFSLEHPVPFKIGLHNDLLALYPEITRQAADQLFRWLVIRRAYLITCREGADRIGFNGPDGKVSAEHEKMARARFAGRQRRAADKWAVEFAP